MMPYRRNYSNSSNKVIFNILTIVKEISYVLLKFIIYKQQSRLADKKKMQFDARDIYDLIQNL